MRKDTLSHAASSSLPVVCWWRSLRPAFAQGAIFTGQIRPTVATNETARAADSRCTTGLRSGGVVSTDRTHTRAWHATRAAARRRGCLSAPDDVRSIAALRAWLTHTQSRIESLTHGESGGNAPMPTRSRLEQARGEAQEGLDELQPFAVNLARPTELPAAGSVYNPEIAACRL